MEVLDEEQYAGSGVGPADADVVELARVAMSANVDSPVVGSDRGSSPGGGRGCVLRRLRLAAAVCLSRVYLGVHFLLDAIAGAGLGMFIGGVLNLVFRVPSSSFSTARANGLR